MHLTLEQLMKAKTLNDKISELLNTQEEIRINRIKDTSNFLKMIFPTLPTR